MFGLDLQSQPLWINLLIFAAGAAAIWFAGARVATYADAIAQKTKLSSAFVGLLFLSLATGTPELGTTVTAASAGNAALAVNNIFGGIAMQTAILAGVDLMIGASALTSLVPDPVLLMEGVLLTGLLGLILVAMVTEGVFPSFWSIGLWTPILLAAQILSLYLIYRYQGHQVWFPHPNKQRFGAENNEEQDNEKDEEETNRRAEQQQSLQRQSLRRLFLLFIAGSAVILFAGVTLAQVGDALATQTGLGSSFVGATLLATATSLPEVSTTITAVRLGNNSMAVSNIFGSNANMVLQLFLADLFYRKGSILAAVDAPIMFAATMGIVLTSVYLVGLLERRDKTIFRMGVDSAIVLVLYFSGLVILYLLRGTSV